MTTKVGLGLLALLGVAASVCLGNLASQGVVLWFSMHLNSTLWLLNIFG